MDILFKVYIFAHIKTITLFSYAINNYTKLPMNLVFIQHYVLCVLWHIHTMHFSYKGSFICRFLFSNEFYSASNIDEITV